MHEYSWDPTGSRVLATTFDEDSQLWTLHSVRPSDGAVQTVRQLATSAPILMYGIDRRRKDAILVKVPRADYEGSDLCELNLTSGDLTVITHDEGPAVWLLAPGLRPAAVVVMENEGGFRVEAVEAEPMDARRVLFRAGPEDAFTTAPIAIDQSGSALYLKSSVGRDTSALIRIDAATGRNEVTIAERPDVDLSTVMFDSLQHQVQVVTFETHRTEYLVFDDEVAADLRKIRESSPGDVHISSRDHRDRRWLVDIEADDVPPAHFVFERDCGTLHSVFSECAALAMFDLARSEPVRVRSRDGLGLTGFWTAPSGIDLRGVVVLVHGGPWERDVGGFSSTLQFFASRGFGCLQVNFRGSIGFGKKFLNAGKKEWGRKMTTDVIDAMSWVISRGYARPGDFVAAGGSYGGFAALSALITAPELFRCAAVWGAPTNLTALLRNAPARWRPLSPHVQTFIGDPRTDAGDLWRCSPIADASRIRAPVLIVQGEMDHLVQRTDTDRFVRALGPLAEYAIFPETGHYFDDPSSKTKLFERIAAFLNGQFPRS